MAKKSTSKKPVRKPLAKKTDHTPSKSFMQRTIKDLLMVVSRTGYYRTQILPKLKKAADQYRAAVKEYEELEQKLLNDPKLKAADRKVTRLRKALHEREKEVVGRLRNRVHKLKYNHERHGPTPAVLKELDSLVREVALLREEED